MNRLAPALRDAALRWIADDLDEPSSADLQGVLVAAMVGDESAVAELADRMAGPLRFGTAGLRGPVRAGRNGMNRAVVVRTTAGVAEWLVANGHTGGTVVIGRDARHGSEAFATAAAEVLSAAGFDVRMTPGPLPTPVLAYLVRALSACAGVQITASHNPPADNGYKLYDDTGAQIVPPADQEIEAAIERAPAAITVPRSTSAQTLDQSVVDGYLTEVAALVPPGQKDLRIVLTPMHGVGGETTMRALHQAGFADVRAVPEQFTPDPDFPTVDFPNPEEPGATDLLLACAAAQDADLAVALDPDADRCAIGVRAPDGGWRMLRGDETGVLLGAHVLSTLDSAMHPSPLVATTIVSSSMLRRIAQAAGARYDETLTGFKWLMRAGDGQGTGLVFAYEEALGICVNPDFVRDKDGVAAAVVAAQLAAEQKAQGGTAVDLLDELELAHGVHQTAQVSLRVDSPQGIAALMTALRRRPPAELAGVGVHYEDLLSRTDAVRFTGEGVRVVVRPSGTEPKVKAYLEVVRAVPRSNPSALAGTRDAAADTLDALRADVRSLLEA